MSRLPERDPPAPRAPRKTAAKSALLRRRCRAGSTRQTSGGQFGATLDATSGQDRSPGTGTHAQTEAVSLGPTTVVRLEGALTHEVLRYCTAIRGSVLRVVRVQKGRVNRCAGVIRDVDQPGSETAARQNYLKLCTEDTGMRERPSTQAPTTVREPLGTVKLVSVCPNAVPPNRSKPAYGGPTGVSLPGDTPIDTTYCEHEHYESDLARLLRGRNRS